MVYTGINLENVKHSNRNAILKLLNDHGAMSRKDIATALGLTPATVTLICADMLSAGMLLEKGEMAEEKRAGRKKVLIDINRRYRYVLSVSIEAEETCIAISDLRGNCMAERKLRMEEYKEPEDLLKNVAQEGKVLMWEHGIGKEEILGVGVSVPGIVKRTEGLSIRALRVWDKPVPVGQILGQYLDYPILVENNVKAFAEGELIYGSGKTHDNMLLIKWGPGVGSAIIIENRIYDGQDRKAAELGHCIVEKNGMLCRCGRRGCLETKVSMNAIARNVKEHFSSQAMPHLDRIIGTDVSRIHARNIREWIQAKDDSLWELLEDGIEVMARTAVNAITVLAPGKVIVFGEIFGLPRFLERFLHYCRMYDSSYGGDFIVKSELGDRSGYIGPLAVAVNELFLMEDRLAE